MPTAPAPPCFLKGTLIRTPAGETPVESLAIGDLIVTYDGVEKPIRWIGHRKFVLEGRKWPAQFIPVCVKQSALGPDCPARDLYLSPGHLVHIDGVLVPVKHLVDGENIVSVTPKPGAAVVYLHIELENHDLLVSEGAPTGSLRAGPGKRERFGNFAEYARLYPDDRREKPLSCCEIYPSGIGRMIYELAGLPHGCLQVAAIRRRLAERVRDRVA
jgi:hypothetical protein